MHYATVLPVSGMGADVTSRLGKETTVAVGIDVCVANVRKTAWFRRVCVHLCKQSQQATGGIIGSASSVLASKADGALAREIDQRLDAKGGSVLVVAER